MGWKAEHWRPISGYEGLYEVSDQGRVRSLCRIRARSNGRELPVRERILKPNAQRSGHLGVVLYNNGRFVVSVHVLVLKAFVGPCPHGMECCHSNGDPADNQLENLRWDTRSANNRDLVLHGNHKQANKTHCIRGHEFTSRNTYPRGNGRECRACMRIRKRQYRQQKRSAA
jgi:hypothetical protein